MNFKDIKELIKIFDKSELSKLKITDKEFAINLEKESGVRVVEPVQQQTLQQSAPSMATTEEVCINTPEVSDSCEYINSPMVGTFYQSPCPDCNPFASVGDSISKGDTMGIVEAMKIMNELEADFSCKIVEVLVEDGQPVEYDMPLFKVERL